MALQYPRSPGENIESMLGRRHPLGLISKASHDSGKPIRIRFIWSKITPTSCHWAQAFSPDGGKTWETNWVQDIQRVQ
jgi:hypothetical protein